MKYVVYILVGKITLSLHHSQFLPKARTKQVRSGKHYCRKGVQAAEILFKISYFGNATGQKAV